MTKTVWLIQATWPLPAPDDDRTGTPRARKIQLMPLKGLVKTYDAKTGKEVPGAGNAQVFMLPPKQPFADGTTVYLNSETDRWSALSFEAQSFKRRKDAEDAAFRVVAAKPYWIGKLAVVKQVLGQKGIGCAGSTRT